ncbi:pimeloyl-ACP methyl ester carboxylesterase [Actinoplanes octamycinicus]|uniref:Pimeloyl-ACP methyl ester carboxylesterase n=1 Tax=Actinoplanes octamycinicus TaxID=135948 RepID=A0A7W7M9N9_9ACTN|nr:alpha/beta hydrolase [Actinoplanes octamycinicus]MBB4742233.1 pimeloyl-ACP methyl ester carboxylesterase [Actinoplanes octamycinicus]GIE59922.1 dihydrolipoamide acetyltransferase [Actinoplanes octamycinicus]
MPSAEFHSRTTTVRGLPTHDLHAAGPGGLPIVLVHGLAVSHRYLMPTARALATRHPVLVPDLPGFGKTGKPRFAYDVSAHAEHLAAWLDTLALPRVCLAGHSFGAEVVARLAVHRPDLTAAIVLAGPTTDPAARSRRALIGRWALDLFVEQPWQAPVLARDVADAKPWRVLATVGHSVRNAIERDLRRLPVPPLVLGGSLDPVAPLLWRTEVATMTGGVAVTIPQAAHNALTTSPRRSADAITAYLRTRMSDVVAVARSRPGPR